MLLQFACRVHAVGSSCYAMAQLGWAITSRLSFIAAIRIYFCGYMSASYFCGHSAFIFAAVRIWLVAAIALKILIRPSAFVGRLVAATRYPPFSYASAAHIRIEVCGYIPHLFQAGLPVFIAATRKCFVAAVVARSLRFSAISLARVDLRL